MGRYVRTQEELKEYILSNVIENHDGCWLWRLSCFAGGYGQCRHHNKNWHTHRLFYTMFVGSIPEGLLVRHLCGNSLCNNPLHLAVGTAMDNHLDSVKHGTDNMFQDKREGSDVHNALITESQVYFIRNEFREERMDVKGLSKLLGVGKWCIEKVINGDNYSCYQDVPPFDWRDLDKIDHFGYLTRKGYRLGRELAEKGYKIIQIQRELGIKDIQARKIFHKRYKELT
jgi:hypothetical protein